MAGETKRDQEAIIESQDAENKELKALIRKISAKLVGLQNLLAKSREA